MIETSRDQERKHLKKFRQCFIYEQQYFIVDTYLNVDGCPSLLRIETTKLATEINIPPFVKILKEVTDIENYNSSSIAKKNYKMPEGDKILINEALGLQKSPNEVREK